MRKDFSPDSDLDILVEFEPAKVPGFQFFEIQEQLSEITSLTVDLNTSNSLSPDFRDVVIREAHIIYKAA